MKLISFISSFLIASCSDPLSGNNNLRKSEIIGNWGLFMTVANIGIGPVWDESSGTWIGNDTTTYCDTCINTIYIFNDKEFSLYSSQSSNGSPKHYLFVSTYSLVSNRIESAMDTYKIEAIQNDVMHLTKI